MENVWHVFSTTNDPKGLTIHSLLDGKLKKKFHTKFKKLVLEILK